MNSQGLRVAACVVYVVFVAEAAQAQFTRPVTVPTSIGATPIPINHGTTQSLTPPGSNLKADLTPTLQTPTATPTVSLPTATATAAASTQTYEAAPAYEPQEASMPESSSEPEAVVASIPESDDSSEAAAFAAIAAAGGSPPPPADASSEDGDDDGDDDDDDEEDDDDEDENEKDDNREAGPLMRAWTRWISWPLWARAISIAIVFMVVAQFRGKR